MLNSELIAELLQRDPNGEVQIYGSEEAVEVSSYWDVKKVNGFVNSPNTVIEIGDLRTVG